jgi:RND superfamily putative drug exporter
MLAFASGRTAKWIAALVWLVLAVASVGLGLPSKFSDAEVNDSASFLPEDAESTRALDAVEELTGGEQAPMVAVFRREGGLRPADRRVIEERIGAFNERRAERAEQGESPFEKTSDFRPAARSDDAVLYSATINAGDGQSETILDPVEEARELISDPGGGLEAKVTGGAGFSADAIKVFESINGTLLLAAGTLVFVLLIVIYRSPFFFLIPLGAVAFAELLSRSVGYGITELGITVNGQSSAILSVLVLGAGTDYALLLVSRYREELHRHEDKHVALRRALRAAGPAIVASALTVSAGLLCLSVAKVNGTAGLGPIGAMGVLVALVTMLTLLPALLAIFGRRAFWPLVPYGPAGAPEPGFLARLPVISRIDAWGRGWELRHRADETHGLWRRVGDWVARQPGRIGLATGALLLVMALGTLNFSTGLTQSDVFLDEVEAVEGQELLAQSFPAGSSAPLDVIVPDPARAEAVAAALGEREEVAQVAPREDVPRATARCCCPRCSPTTPTRRPPTPPFPACATPPRRPAGTTCSSAGRRRSRRTCATRRRRTRGRSSRWSSSSSSSS